MDKIYERADQRLRERHQKWADLAKALGYSDQRVHNWSKRGIPKDALARVADFLGVTTDWLIAGRGQKSDIFQQVSELEAKDIRRPEDAHLTDAQILERAQQEDMRRDSEWEAGTPEEYRARPKEAGRPHANEVEFVGHLDAWDSSTGLGPDEIEVPLFREVELAAGSGATQVIENHGAKLRFAKSTLARAGVPMEAAACAYVRGNSMEPKMPDGTCIGVNTADTAVRDGKTYAMDHEGMLRVKILHRRPGGGLKVVSMNQEEHPPELYTAEEVQESIRIIGRVFWYSGLM